MLNGQAACWGNVPTSLTGNAYSSLGAPTLIHTGIREVQTLGAGGRVIAYSDGYLTMPDAVNVMYAPEDLNFAPRFIVSATASSSGVSIYVLDK
jgi:hypothetical protein